MELKIEKEKENVWKQAFFLCSKGGDGLSYQIIITHNQTHYIPTVLDGIEWSTERTGSPGKLTFSTIGKEVAFEEGDAVQFYVDGTPVFFGFLFTQKHTEDEEISWTAYDQLRYLQYKDTILYKDLTATELIRLIARTAELQVGSLADTGMKIARRLEDNTSYFEMIQNALDETLTVRGRNYVLYDNFGKLELADLESMLLDVLLDAETGESYEYTSSIDTNTYNRIKLAYDNEDSGMRDIYIAQDSSNINRWGVLQYFESLPSPNGAQAKADALLSFYDRKMKNLSLSGMAGDARVRAGTSVAVLLTLGDGTKLQNYMLVEKARHRFRESEHTMDLTLRGGDFVV